MKKTTFWISKIAGLGFLFVGWILFSEFACLAWPSAAYIQAEQELDQYRRDHRSWERDRNEWEAERNVWRNERDEWERLRNEWEQWPAVNIVKIQQRQFEEVLAGVRPASDISDVELRELAEAVVLLTRGSEPEGPSGAEQWAQAISLLVSVDVQGTTRPHRYISQSCVLHDQLRLIRLLSGDVAAVQPTLPERPVPPRHPDPLRDQPAEPLSRPTLPTGSASIGQLPLQGTIYLPLAVWVIAATVFMLGFVLAGFVSFFFNKDRQEAHPLRSFPNFIFGWIVMVAAAPGWIVFQFLRLLFSDLGPLWKWGRHKLGRLTEEEKRASFVERLRAIKDRAQGNDGLIQQIDELIKRAEHRGQKETLAALEREALEIGLVLDARDEADEV